jgi:hypothetical protein
LPLPAEKIESERIGKERKLAINNRLSVIKKFTCYQFEQFKMQLNFEISVLRSNGEERTISAVENNITFGRKNCNLEKRNEYTISGT